jgi:hypothetical protein
MTSSLPNHGPLAPASDGFDEYPPDAGNRYEDRLRGLDRQQLADRDLAGTRKTRSALPSPAGRSAFRHPRPHGCPLPGPRSVTRAGVLR